MPYRIDTHVDARARREALAADVRRGLGARPRSLPPKYFYDAAGSRLFEEITRLPEYYLTRVEAALLDEWAPALMRSLAPHDVVELGSGFSLKTRRLLAARERARAAALHCRSTWTRRPSPPRPIGSCPRIHRSRSTRSSATSSATCRTCRPRSAAVSCCSSAARSAT